MGSDWRYWTIVAAKSSHDDPAWLLGTILERPLDFGSATRFGKDKSAKYHCRTLSTRADDSNESQMLSQVLQKLVGLQGFDVQAWPALLQFSSDAEVHLLPEFYEAPISDRLMRLRKVEKTFRLYMVSQIRRFKLVGVHEGSTVKTGRLLLAYTVDEVVYTQTKSDPGSLAVRFGGSEDMEAKDSWIASTMPLQRESFVEEAVDNVDMVFADHEGMTWSLDKKLASELRGSINGREEDPGPMKASRFLPDLLLSKLEYKIKRKLSTLQWGRRVLRILLRPKRPPGFERFEWFCSCGVLLHADYEVTSDESAEALRSLKLKLILAGRPSGDKRSSAPPSKSAPSAGTTSPSSFPTSRNSVDITDRRSFRRQTPRWSSSEYLDDEQQLQPETRTCFELCINTELRRTVLEELEITTQGGHRLIYNDHKLFSTIHNVYYAERHKTRYRWFREPVDVHFVQFAGDLGLTAQAESFHVGIYDQPKALPSKDQIANGRYDILDPLPLGVPIARDTFLHYLSSHPTAIDTNTHVFLERFAKKCSDKVIPSNGKMTSKLEPEWGIRVIEGPSFRMFGVMATILGILWPLGGSLLAWLLGEDVHKGLIGGGVAFTISTFLLGFFYNMMKDRAEQAKAKQA